MSALDNLDLPTLKRATVTIPADRITTLFSAPVTIVPGVAGKILVPEFLHVRKRAGTAWSSGGSGVLKLRCDTAVYFGLFDQTATTGFFGAAEAVWVASAGAGQFWSLGGVTSSSSISGADLVFALTSANISNGNGSMTVDVWYREWPGL